MNRITNYRKLFGVDQNTKLSELKLIYRNLMKECHPDKFQDDELKNQAEIKSKQIIGAYHFLVSISEETHAQNVEEYTQLTNTGIIEDYQYKGTNLKITFQDGRTYEYLGVPKNIYTKMNSAPALARFARRHVYFSFTFRNISKQNTE